MGGAGANLTWAGARAFALAQNLLPPEVARVQLPAMRERDPELAQCVSEALELERLVQAASSP